MVHFPKEATAQTEGLMPARFDPDYVERAARPFLLAASFAADPPLLPMIPLRFSKEAAVPPHLWGILYDGWRPAMEEEGLSVFIQGYEKRGPDNARKRIYYSAVTPDLYAAHYRPKIRRLFDRLLAPEHADEPLMAIYYRNYFDMYWDLHLGVEGDAVPDEVRAFGESFNAVIGHFFPTEDVVYENYMRARDLREPLREWVDARVQDLLDGRIPNPEATFVHYWLTNGDQGEHFRRKDVVFECFHNFLAFSQWGAALYNIMRRLSDDRGEAEIRDAFAAAMRGAPDEPDGCAFTPLDRFAMELMRVISPNAGSFSRLEPRHSLLSTGGGILHPHVEANIDPRHWEAPETFDPDRFRSAATSDQDPEARAAAAGLARCPFAPVSAPVSDGREVALANGAFGAVHPVIDGQAHPVCDTAGYAPFGFGYRRCPGEFLTIEAIKDFLRKVWEDGLAFRRLDLDRPERRPVGPGAIVEDDIGFTRG